MARSGSTTRLEKQREWQTKDHELGTLCPLELIRKRDFEIVMILCLRRFSPSDGVAMEERRDEGGGKENRLVHEDTKGASRRGELQGDA